MQKDTYIQGFRERLEKACIESGMSKTEIARRAGFERRTLNQTPRRMMGSAHIAKFCAVTGTDANWLLGVKR